MTRRSLEETRALLLRTGAGMLRSGVAEFTAASVRLIDVCREAGLKTAGSGYKIWPTQEAFRVDLLRHCLDASGTSEDFSSETIEMARDLVNDLDGAQEIIRVMGAVSAATTIGSPDYNLYVALWCAAANDPVLADQLRASDEGLLAITEQMYDTIVEELDLEWIEPFDARQLATMLSALVEGLALRARYEPGRVPDAVMRPTGPDGAEQPWHLFACGAEALITAMTRPAARPADTDGTDDADSTA